MLLEISYLGQPRIGVTTVGKWRTLANKKRYMA